MFFTTSTFDAVSPIVSSSSAERIVTSVLTEHQEAQPNSQRDNSDVNKQPYGHEEASLTVNNSENIFSCLYETDL